MTLGRFDTRATCWAMLEREAAISSARKRLRGSRRAKGWPREFRHRSPADRARKRWAPPAASRHARVGSPRCAPDAMSSWKPASSCPHSGRQSQAPAAQSAAADSRRPECAARARGRPLLPNVPVLCPSIAAAIRPSLSEYPGGEGRQNTHIVTAAIERNQLLAVVRRNDSAPDAHLPR